MLMTRYNVFQVFAYLHRDATALEEPRQLSDELVEFDYNYFITRGGTLGVKSIASTVILVETKVLLGPEYASGQILLRVFFLYLRFFNASENL